MIHRECGRTYFTRLLPAWTWGDVPSGSTATREQVMHGLDRERVKTALCVDHYIAVKFRKLERRKSSLFDRRETL